MNLLTLDFRALPAEQKKHLAEHMQASLEETMQGFPLWNRLFAQLLCIQRAYNFYTALGGRLSQPAPKLLPAMQEMLWKYFLGEVSREDFEAFAAAADSVVLQIAVGDDSGQEEFADFWKEYAAGWEYSVVCSLYAHLAMLPDYLFNDIMEDRTEWYLMTDSELLEVIEGEIDFGELEPVFRVEGGGYHPSELERHLLEVYDTPTFARCFALLQEDLRLASEVPEGDTAALQKIREAYRGKGLFTEEEIGKIVPAYREMFELDEAE